MDGYNGIMENPIKLDDLGVPLFLETPIHQWKLLMAKEILGFNASWFAQREDPSVAVERLNEEERVGELEKILGWTSIWETKFKKKQRNFTHFSSFLCPNFWHIFLVKIRCPSWKTWLVLIFLDHTWWNMAHRSYKAEKLPLGARLEPYATMEWVEAAKWLMILGLAYLPFEWICF